MKRKRILWTTVCFLVLTFSISDFYLFAAEPEQQEAELYHYAYQGEQVETSSHYFTFQWWYKDSSRESIRNRHHATNIFKLKNLEDSTDHPAAYCSDFLYSIVSDSKYKRLNLEDATYYNQAAAQHIRSIMENGYWHDWTSEELKNAEAKANAWMETYDPASFETGAFLPYDAEEEVEKISDLTADEALMATQLAIWAFANTEGDDWWVKYYESLLTNVEGRYQSQPLPDNVRAFRKYLIHQQSLPLQPEDILFTDQYFITDSIAFTGSLSDAAVYDLRLLVKLAAPIDPEDELTLTAAFGNGRSESFPLGGDKGLTPDNNGYYTLALNDVTKGEAAAVSLTISGQQYAEGIYFYEAKSAEGTPRETSQNLVGKASGMTPVSVTTDLTYEIGTKSVSLKKSDAEDSRPLAGAVFNLYGEKEGKSYLVLESLTTNENGQITVSNLPEEFVYYFVETKAPEGYEMEDIGSRHYADDKGTISVFNRKVPTANPEPEIPVIPEEPDDPVEPEDSKEPVTPIEPVNPEMPAKPVVSPNVPINKPAIETPALQHKNVPCSDAPETADTSPLGALLLLFFLAGLGLFYGVFYKK
ncbi:MAG: Cys-Gln thioester bond-forming surface protein [Firmicutes bacterium]|nr:Cys-Gln thioester bond-forming surface protein [Bacillota bacterium]